MNSKEILVSQLESINLSKDEAKIYIELFEKPNTHLQLARNTGINRTKVYRIVEQLEKRSLVSRRTDDRGTFLAANDPSALEIELAAQEQELKKQRNALAYAIPGLKSFYQEAKTSFVINTYEGYEGLRQMQWGELRTKKELLVFGNSTIEDMVADHRWAERMRSRAVEKGYKTREIYNESSKKPDFTTNQAYMSLYEVRRVSEKDLPIATPMVIYNDTVAIYQFTDGKRVGVEIVNEGFAQTMKNIFEHYWKTAKK